METAQLVLEYLTVLIWPCVVVYVLLVYRNNISELFRRLTEDSDEIEAKFLGLSAKFRRQIETLSSEASSSPSEAATNIQLGVQRLALEQLRVLAANFFTESLGVRRQTAHEVRELSRQLPLSSLLELAESGLPGERVAAGIGIGERLLSSPEVAEDKAVLEAVRAGVADAQSRVRYRFVLAARQNPIIAAALWGDLRELASSDDSAAVRKEAKRA